MLTPREFFSTFSITMSLLYLTLPSIQAINANDYDSWQGSRICDSDSKYKPSVYCNKASTGSTARCISENLAMMDGYNTLGLFPRTVVVCERSSQIDACVTGASTDKQYLLWSYYEPPEDASPDEEGVYPSSKCYHPKSKKT